MCTRAPIRTADPTMDLARCRTGESGHNRSGNREKARDMDLRFGAEVREVEAALSHEPELRREGSARQHRRKR